MTVSELRIGNWVILSGKPRQVQTVGMWLYYHHPKLNSTITALYNAADTTIDEVPIEAIEAIRLQEKN